MKLAHLAFTVSNMEKSLQFYCSGLGFRKAFSLADDHGNPWIEYLEIANNQFIELFYSSELVNSNQIQSYEHLCLEVDDIFTTILDLEQKGIKIYIYPLLGKDHNYQAWIKDPDGNRIELMQYTAQSLQLNYQKKER